MRLIIKKLKQQSFKWPERMERVFPKMPGRNFYSKICDNLRNYENGNFIKRRYEFGYFYETLKSHNRRLREFQIFVFWLWLCIARPWRIKAGFKPFYDWPLNKDRLFLDKMIKTLNKVKEKFKDDPLLCDFFPHYDEAWLKRNLKKYLELGIFVNAYLLLKDFVDNAETFRYQNRFLSLLKQREVIKKRDVQQALKIDSKNFDALASWAKEKGLIKIIENSTWVIYIKPKGYA
jgi:hypothetical protein